MNTVKSIMIVGVGGQGTLLASRLLGNALLSQGFDVKVSEVHGMSQRGGSVVTYVRYGKEVHSPIIEIGEADVILSFELLEAARYLPYLKEGGTMIINTQQIDPMPVITGAAQYPQGIVQSLKDHDVNLTALDAKALATEAGSVKAINVVLVGVLASSLGFPDDVWADTLAATVPPKFLELNRKAFALGQKHSLE